MLDLVIRQRLCIALIKSALRDRDYCWLTSDAGQYICDELNINADELIYSFKRYYADRQLRSLSIDKIIKRLFI